MLAVWSVPTKFFISSMTGWGFSVSTPVVEIGVGYNWLYMALTDATTGQQIMYKGNGGSCGVGCGVLPGSVNLADESHVTLNNRIYTYPNKSISAEDLVGNIDTYNTGIQVASTKKRSSMLIYFLESGFAGNIGWSVKAAAVVYGESQVTDFAQANVEAARYNLSFA